jgi:hypothetical protein
LAAVDSSIEEDRDRNMVTPIRAATAIVIRIMAPPLLAEIALGASKHLLKSLAALPLLICAPRLNGLRYGAISASGKKVAIVGERPKRRDTP